MPHAVSQSCALILKGIVPGYVENAFLYNPCVAWDGYSNLDLAVQITTYSCGMITMRNKSYRQEKSHELKSMPSFTSDQTTVEAENDFDF